MPHKSNVPEMYPEHDETEEVTQAIAEVGPLPQVSAPSHGPAVLYEKTGGIGLLRLNRPEKLNAMNYEMGYELRDLVAGIREDSSLRALVVTGSGKAFSAGGDLSFILENITRRPQENYRTMHEFYELFLCIREVPVPIIAAINGAAIGAGFCLALACDLRICATDARLGVTFVKLNLHPGMGAELFLTRLVGPARASELLLTGRVMDGIEAERLGLVNMVVPSGAVLERAMELAGQIAACGPLAVRQTLQTLRKLAAAELATVLHEEASAQAQDFTTADLIEGVQAVREGRLPRFEGR
jgi:enoyl-CoA hydratase/carnithine racemase